VTGLASEKLARFKEFAKRHPRLVEEVRSNRRSWQDIYEEWVIFGEDHEIWDPYLTEKEKENRSSSAKTEPNRNVNRPSNPFANRPPAPPNLFSLLSRIDFDDLQHYMSQIDGALSTVQQLIEKFPKGEGRPPGYGPSSPQNQPLFPFRKD
jgi:hypothetical protein